MHYLPEPQEEYQHKVLDMFLQQKGGGLASTRAGTSHELAAVVRLRDTPPTSHGPQPFTEKVSNSSTTLKRAARQSTAAVSSQAAKWGMNSARARVCATQPRFSKGCQSKRPCHLTTVLIPPFPCPGTPLP